MSNRWCSLIKDLLNKKRTWNTWNEGVKLAIIILQYLVTDILLEQQVGEIDITLKTLRYIFCDSSVFIASREKRIVKSLCYSRRNVQCVRCWISLHHVISIRSVNNTQDWRKFWKRFRVCFVFQSRVSTKTVVIALLESQYKQQCTWTWTLTTGKIP